MFKFTYNRHAVDVAPQIVLWLVGMVLGIYFLYLIKFIILLLFLAFILMVALKPAVWRVKRWLHLPLVPSIALVYIGVVIGLISLLGLILPPLVTQLSQFVGVFDIPGLQDEIKNWRFTFSEVTTMLSGIGGSFGVVMGVINSTFNVFFAIITTLVMSFYLMLDREVLHLKLRWFTKDQAKVRLGKEFLDSLESQLGGWVRGQIILMLLIGMATFAGLTILGIPYALPLAVLAGTLEILPNLGPTIAAVPAVALVLLSGDWIMTGIVLAFYIVLQQVENNLIVPKVIRDNADVNPLIAMVMILIGVTLGGVMGALLAVPAYIVLRASYALWYERSHHHLV